jgi:hypothetical protein
MWVGVVMALVGFVLPWAMLDVKSPKLPQQLQDAADATPVSDILSRLTKGVGRVVVQVKRGAETVTGELPDLQTMPHEVRGVDIPMLANRHDAQVLMSLAEMLTGQRQLGAKSYAVYVLPGLALACGIVLTIASGQRILALVLGLLCVAVAAGGYWKISTTPLDALLVAITIGQGMWLSLWGYALVGVSSLALTLVGGKVAR